MKKHQKRKISEMTKPELEIRRDYLKSKLPPYKKTSNVIKYIESHIEKFEKRT